MQPEPSRVGVRGYLEPEIRAACEKDKGLPTANLSDRELAESAFRAALLACREALALRREIQPLLREAETQAALVAFLKEQAAATKSRSEVVKRAASAWIPAIAALLAAVAAWFKG